MMKIFLIVFTILFTSQVSAYEIDTHGFITYEAYKQSLLQTDTSLLNELGIENKVNAFGNTYYDMEIPDSDTGIQTIWERTNQKYEDKIIKGFIKQETLSLHGWLIRGAIREDDNLRPLNHFYDPVNDTGLTFITPGHKSPNWAFGTYYFNSSPIQDNRDAFDNHYTILDAQDAMYRALTGRNKNGNTEIGANGELVATKAVRQAYWATTFRALGDVIHLLQDMGQPQHTRDDIHNDIINSEERTSYEAYSNARALNLEFQKRCFDGKNITIDPLLYTFKTGPYPIPKFNKYGDFWTTNPNSTAGGKGLADFSNHNFFSEGTNNPNGESGDYLYPSNNTFTFSENTYTDPCLVRYNAKLITLSADVVDQKTGLTDQNVSLSTRSLWDHPDGDNLPKYVLTKENYDAMADLLVPRAVSYSAGLINHFFRGRLQVLQASKLGNELTLRFKNVSATDQYNNGIVFNEGKFEVFYEDINGIMQPLTVTSSDLPSGDTTVASGDNMLHDTTYTFTVAHPPEDNIAPAPYTDASGNKLGTDTPFVLVFRGQIGQDAGIAAITFARDGLLAYYGYRDAATDIKGNAVPLVDFDLRVTSNPAKPWRAFSKGPTPVAGVDPGWMTYLNHNQLTISGGYATSDTSLPPALFRSLNGGRSFADSELDLAPNPSTWKLSKEDNTYMASVYVGGSSLVTLRQDGNGTASGTVSYRYYQSDDFGQTWVAGGLLDNVNQRLGPLVYLGESGGLKHYVAIAMNNVLNDSNQLVTEWVLHRSNDSGQSFTVQRIPEIITFSPSTGAATAMIVHMGLDASGNATLGLAVKTGLVTIPYNGSEIKFYVSTDSGLSWNERSTLPLSPSILAGKFPATDNGYVRDLLYLGTPTAGLPVLYLSVMQEETIIQTEESIKEFFVSNDGGVTWLPTPGPELGLTTITDLDGNAWEVMTKFPWLVYPLDNGAIPGLYD